MNLSSFKEKYKEIHDLGSKWDLIKMEIRGFTIQYYKRNAKNKKPRPGEIFIQKSKRSSSKC